MLLCAYGIGWIHDEPVNLGFKLDDVLQLELTESAVNGRVLCAKSATSPLAKFYDLDLGERLSDVHVGVKSNSSASSSSPHSAYAYWSRDGTFVAFVESSANHTSAKLVVKRVENGEWYGSVPLFDKRPASTTSTITSVTLSSHYAAITVRKSASPLLVDLHACRLIHT